MADVTNHGTAWPFDKSPAGAKSNFRGSGVKQNKKGNPNSSPWTGGADRGADYTRTSSNKAGLGPKKPSDARPGNPLYAGNRDRSGKI
jgi:hypothetical protein